MSPARAMNYRRFCLGLAFWLVAGPAGSAQETAGIQKNFINQPSFFLPIQLDAAGRTQVSEIRVYSKKRPTEPWNYVATCAPTQNGIPFTAEGDGENFFAMLLVDRQGQSSPAKIENATANALIVVDTAPPQAEVQTVNTAPEGQYVTVRVNDRHPDLGKVQLSYQTQDMIWRPLDSVANKPTLFCIPAQANTTGMVRIVVHDLAGNSATRDLSLSQAVASNSPATPASTPIQAPPEPAVIQVEAFQLPAAVPQKMPPGNYLPFTGVERVQKQDFSNQNSSVQTLLAQSPVPSAIAVESPISKSVAPSLVSPGTTAMGRKLLNSPQMLLEYQVDKIGRSGIGKVEVWITRNGQGWEKLAEDVQGKSPLSLKLPGDGLFGLTLVVANGRGFGGLAPKMGDAPEGWVEVDTTRPVAEITEIRQGVGDDSGSLHIGWSCKDKNLTSDPVDLFYAAEPQGQKWLPIAKNLRAEGQYRWTPPTTVGPQAFLRIVARDQAGNMTVLDTTQPVTLDDLSRPRARIFNITPLAPGGMPPTGN